MKTTALFGLCGTAVVALAGVAFLTLPGGDAHAQSGSRLCGYIMKGDDGGYTGYLYEAREADVDFEDDCGSAAGDLYSKYIDSSVNPNAESSVMHDDTDCHDLPSSHGAWHRHCENTCEDVGVNFQSSNSPKDMCDKMEAHQKYKVVFDKASNTTSYKKL